MTINIDQTDTAFVLSINTPNISETILFLQLISQHSNTGLVTFSGETIASNDRFTAINFVIPTDFALNHYNGMYDYRVYNNEEYETGVCKLITTPGGTTGTQAFISNNENRQAEVIYRPSYE